MASPEELEARVSRLEQEVAQLQTRVAETSADAAAARVLAGGADRDVAEMRTEIREEMRAHTRALNALLETQAEHTVQVGDLGRRLSSVEADLTSLGARIDSLETEMRAGFAEMKSGMAQIVTLLGGAPPA
jgi:chromosome segregation ATPase